MPASVGVEPIAFGPEGDLAPGARLGRTVGEAKVESGEPAPEVDVVVVAAGAGEAELGVGGLRLSCQKFCSRKQQAGLVAVPA